MAHFVDVDRENDADGELPSPERPVNTHREEHRDKGAGFGEAEEKELCFGEYKEDHDFEFPEEQSEDSEGSAALRPFRLGRRLRRLWGVDPAAQLFNL